MSVGLTTTASDLDILKQAAAYRMDERTRPDPAIVIEALLQAEKRVNSSDRPTRYRYWDSGDCASQQKLASCAAEVALLWAKAFTCRA